MLSSHGNQPSRPIRWAISLAIHQPGLDSYRGSTTGCRTARNGSRYAGWWTSSHLSRYVHSGRTTSAQPQISAGSTSTATTKSSSRSACLVFSGAGSAWMRFVPYTNQPLMS